MLTNLYKPRAYIRDFTLCFILRIDSSSGPTTSIILKFQLAKMAESSSIFFTSLVHRGKKSLRILYSGDFARVNFLELNFTKDFAVINFREWSLTRNFAGIDFRVSRKENFFTIFYDGFRMISVKINTFLLNQMTEIFNGLERT